jgi:hypothetical protein
VTLRKALVASFVVAGLAYAAPAALPENTLFACATVLSLAWSALTGWILLKFRKRGALALGGLSLALFWPAAGALLALSCRLGYECL